MFRQERLGLCHGAVSYTVWICRNHLAAFEVVGPGLRSGMDLVIAVPMFRTERCGKLFMTLGGNRDSAVMDGHPVDQPGTSREGSIN